MSEQAKSGFVAHLIELRDRLIKSLFSILVIFIGLVYFANDIYEFVAAPLVAHLPSTATMIATDVTAPFFAPFKLTLFVALFGIYSTWLIPTRKTHANANFGLEYFAILWRYRFLLLYSAPYYIRLFY